MSKTFADAYRESLYKILNDNDDLVEQIKQRMVEKVDPVVETYGKLADKILNDDPQAWSKINSPEALLIYLKKKVYDGYPASETELKALETMATRIEKEKVNEELARLILFSDGKD